MQYENSVKASILNREYIDRTADVSKDLPPQEITYKVLESLLKICSDRSFRVILVEDLDECYKVFIQIPDGKSSCDFRVWRATFHDGQLADLKVPSHDDLGKTFRNLKDSSKNVDEHLINAVMKLIRDRWSVDRVLERYFSQERGDVVKEIKRFLATLKWIALQEDVNYPPPKKLGSRYTLAVYALLEAGFSLSEVRRIIRF